MQTMLDFNLNVPEYLTLDIITNVPVLPTVYIVMKALFGLVFLVLVLLWCYYKCRYARTLSIASKLSTEVPAYPIVGHTPYYLRKDFMGLFFRAIKSIAKGTISACLWMGPFPVFVITSADDIHTIVTSSKTSEKSVEYSFLNTALGNGILTAPGHIHRITRRHINPIFTPRNLEQLMTVFNASGRHLVQHLSLFVDQGVVDIFPTVTRNALRNVTFVLFGPDLEIDKYSEELEDMYQTISRITNLLVERTVKFWLWSDFLFNILWSKEIKEIRTGIKNYADIPRKAYEDKQNLGQPNMYDSKPFTLSDAFKNLRETHPEFTEEYHKGEIATLATTGTDSTKVVISYCLLALAVNPQIQDKLYQEVVSVMGEEDRDVTLQDLKDMPYLDQVFKESLRCSSAIPYFGRTTKEDIKLRDFTVPAGNTILSCLAGMNHNPEVFPNPENFDPEHFAPERVAQMKRYSFMPFSGGSRNCIGKTYANIFTKIAIVKVLLKYSLSSSVDINRLAYHFGITIYYKDGYPLELQHRNPQSIL